MLITSLLLSALTCNPGFAYHLNAHSALPLGEVKVFTVHASNQRMRAAKIMNPHTSLLTRYNLSVTFTPAVWDSYRIRVSMAALPYARIYTELNALFAILRGKPRSPECFSFSVYALSCLENSYVLGYLEN